VYILDCIYYLTTQYHVQALRRLTCFSNYKKQCCCLTDRKPGRGWQTNIWVQFCELQYLRSLSAPWLINWSILSIGWDVSELQPPVGLLFIPRVTCERGQEWWWWWWWWWLGKTADSSTSGNPSSRDIWERVGGMVAEVRISRVSIWDALTDLEHAVKSYDVGPPALLPIRRKLCCGILSSKIHRLGRVWTRDP
jgi:hypothetical protein